VFSLANIQTFCLCPGPLQGPRQLHVEERRSHDGDYRDRHLNTPPSAAGEQHSLNSSEDKIHLMVTWRVRSILINCSIK